MIRHLKVYGRRFGDALLPPTCTLCGGATMGALLCAPCTADLPWNTPACPGCALPAAQPVLCPACLHKPRAFDAAHAAFVLATPVQEGIHALKYQARFQQAALLGTAFASRVRARTEPLPTLLIPVPLHWRRQWSRGYNQSIELARVIGMELGIAVDATAAKRLRATPDQIGQSAAQRRKNLKDAFAVCPRVAGQHVALLDDVMTTGATLEELARACKAVGATTIEAWAIARQPLH
ncbi:MAG: ComF family protein [Stagnimonas sp.]|nr:ComF family protein [Stagnimonas sp.]